MSVPSFSDLGKSARDVFRTGYHYGKSLIKLNVRAKSSGNVEMNSDLRLEYETSKVRERLKIYDVWVVDIFLCEFHMLLVTSRVSRNF